MTDTTIEAPASGGGTRRSGALAAMRLAELQGLASSMGIGGTTKMRKGDLVAAIKARQNGDDVAAPAQERRGEPPRSSSDDDQTTGHPGRDAGAAGSGSRTEVQRREASSNGDRSTADRSEHMPQGEQGQPEQQGQRDRQQEPQRQRDRQGQPDQHGSRQDDDGRGGRRRRNRGRSRDKRRGQGAVNTAQAEPGEPQIREDDVLVPVAGILDILDSYAFVRTTGYLPGSSDVYVPLQMVKRHGLRKGDAVTGSIKAPREGEEPQQQTVGSRHN
ncbi:MAG: Rho termination factor N-terminal domain-containing protein, partial [Dermatophilaceae bacterium]